MSKNEAEDLDDLDGVDQQPASTTDRVDALERKLAVREIASDYSLNEKGASAVYELAKTANLSPGEALAVLQQREPDKYGGGGGAAAGFASLSPRPGSAPRVKIDEVEERKKARNALRMTDRKAYNKALDHEMGGHLAEAMGWFHPLNPNGGN